MFWKLLSPYLSANINANTHSILHQSGKSWSKVTSLADKSHACKQTPASLGRTRLLQARDMHLWIDGSPYLPSTSAWMLLAGHLALKRQSRWRHAGLEQPQSTDQRHSAATTSCCSMNAAGLCAVPGAKSRPSRPTPCDPRLLCPWASPSRQQYWRPPSHTWAVQAHSSSWTSHPCCLLPDSSRAPALSIFLQVLVPTQGPTAIHPSINEMDWWWTCG